MAQIAPFLLYPMTALIRFNADRQLARNDHPSELDAQRSLSTMRYAIDRYRRYLWFIKQSAHQGLYSWLCLSQPNAPILLLYSLFIDNLLLFY